MSFSTEVVSNLFIKLHGKFQDVNFTYDHAEPNKISFVREGYPEGIIYVSEFNETYSFVTTSMTFHHDAMDKMTPETFGMLSNQENLLRRGISILTGLVEGEYVLRAGFIALKGRMLDEYLNIINDITNLYVMHEKLFDYIQNLTDDEEIYSVRASEKVLALADGYSIDGKSIFSEVLDYAEAELDLKVERINDHEALINCESSETKSYFRLYEDKPLITLTTTFIVSSFEDGVEYSEALNLKVPYGHFSPILFRDGQPAIEFHVHQYLFEGMDSFKVAQIFEVFNYGVTYISELFEEDPA